MASALLAAAASWASLWHQELDESGQELVLENGEEVLVCAKSFDPPPIMPKFSVEVWRGVDPVKVSLEIFNVLVRFEEVVSKGLSEVGPVFVFGHTGWVQASLLAVGVRQNKEWGLEVVA